MIKKIQIFTDVAVCVSTCLHFGHSAFVAVFWLLYFGGCVLVASQVA